MAFRRSAVRLRSAPPISPVRIPCRTRGSAPRGGGSLALGCDRRVEAARTDTVGSMSAGTRRALPRAVSIPVSDRRERRTGRAPVSDLGSLPPTHRLSRRIRSNSGSLVDQRGARSLRPRPRPRCVAKGARPPRERSGGCDHRSAYVSRNGVQTYPRRDGPGRSGRSRPSRAVEPDGGQALPFPDGASTRRSMKKKRPE